MIRVSNHKAGDRSTDKGAGIYTEITRAAKAVTMPSLTIAFPLMLSIKPTQCGIYSIRLITLP